MKSLPNYALAILCLLPTLLRAGTVTNSAGDMTPGSLRGVIAAAVANETITFAPNLSGATIPLGGDDIVLNRNLTIDASSLTGGITVDGENLSRAFCVEINAAPSITIKNLTIINGTQNSGVGLTGNHGGGIYIGDGNLALTDCTLDGNSASLGGGIYCWRGSFVLTNCTLNGNSASQNGGGIYIQGPASGVTSNCALSDCTLSNNTAANTGGGIHSGGDTADGTVSLSLSGCTLSDNAATTSNGGGLYIGASVSGPNVTAALDHCTFGGNSAGFQGGGISAANSNAMPSTLTITSCTLSENSADFDGGGIFVNDANFTLTASIVAGNTAVDNGAQGPDIRRIIGADGSANLSNNLVGGSPMLAPLGDNGGPTLTMLPLAGSPAIDGGGSTDPGGGDQRGFPRFVNGALDIGAVESGTAFPLMVDTAVDENDGIATGDTSLRDAIAASPSGGTIAFAPGLDGSVITLANGQLVIDKDLTIDASALTGGLTIDADGLSTNHRVLEVTPGSAVTLEGLTITGGKTADGIAGVHGGNSATDAANGGGIYNAGDLNLTACTVSGNATGDGGDGSDGLVLGNSGGDGHSGGSGGGIYNTVGASLVLTHCTIAANTTGNGGRGGSGIAFIGSGDGGDGGDGGFGAGIYNSDGALLALTHCTVSANITGNWGIGGSGSSDGLYGSGGFGGGIRDQNTLTLDHTIVSGNQTGFGGSGPDLAKSAGSFTGTGINFIGDPSGSSVALTGTILSGDALLAPLANYGGPNQTMLPLPGSPVFNPAGGNNSSPFAFDQRGFARVFDGTLDIGAVEYAPILSVVVDTHMDGPSSGGFSLREAIAITASGGSITFAPSLGGSTIELTQGQLVIDRDLIIDASELAGGIAIDANGAVTNHRVLQVGVGANVALSKLALTGGRTADGIDGINFNHGGDANNGGGIHNSGDLTLTGCTLAGNATGDGGSGSGGGVAGAGFDGGAGGDGGGIYTEVGASLVLTHCTIAENSTGDGGRGGGGGVFSSDGDGGDAGSGGGIYSSSGTSLTLTHCSVASNTTGRGGQGENGGSGGSGGGIADDGGLVLNNSLISDNQTGTGPFGGPGATGPDLAKPSGSFTGSGVNFIGDTSGSAVPLTGFILSGDAMLAPLANYGGSTQTKPPLLGSPAIDPAGGGNSSPFPVDQRGVPRVINGILDIGAVEYGRALVVDTLIDENDGADTGGVSLREAIADTDTGTTVTFAESVDGGTITLTNGELVIGKDLNIDASALADGITIDADGITTGHRVMQISSGVVVALSKLTLTGGKSSDGFDASGDNGDSGGSASDGGGIHNSGDLTLTGCRIIGNATGRGGYGGEGNGGGGSDRHGGNGGNGGLGGGIYNHFGASLDLTRCTISGNSTGSGGRGGDGATSSFGSGDGGAAGRGGSGGGIFNSGRAVLTMEHCTIAGNVTGSGDKGGGGGGNSGDGGDGGSGGDGGGIFSTVEASLLLTHCTISTNTTGDGGDRGTPGNSGFQGFIGSGGRGGGIRDLGFVNLNLTLISNNLTGSAPFGSNAPGPDLAKNLGTFTGSGINFIGITSGSSVALTGSILSGDAMLSPLGNYGGSTPTMLPLAASPVIDPAGGGLSSPFATDQRGFDRVFNDIVDIGAVEYSPPPIVVDTNIDENDGVFTGGVSLRDAIAAAGPGATVTFVPALSGDTITLTNGQLVIDKDLAIDASTLAGGIAVDANGIATNHRVLQVGAGNTVTLKKLTIKGGKTPDGPSSTGGGIHNSGNLKLTGCLVAGNTTGAEDGGFGGWGGGIFNSTGASLVLCDCTVSGNSTAMGSFGGGWGAGIANGNGANLTLTRCTVSNNTTGIGGAGGLGGLGGGIDNAGVLVLEQSTVSGNTTGSGPLTGGGGGGIHNGTNASLTLTHCTISNNTTGDGGTGTGGEGGGIRNFGDLILTSTLIAGNVTGENDLSVAAPGPDLAVNNGSYTGNGVNFIGDTTGSAVPLTGTILSGSAMLAPLGDYGGPTQTMALRPGSPAIDAATPVGLFDQRGFSRFVGAAPDIGAYESGNASGYTVWAIEMIPDGLDASFGGDAEGDNAPNGSEYALGTAALLSDPKSPNSPTLLELPSGAVEITFGFNPAAATDTRWIIMRSTDLVNFTEIFNYHGPSSIGTPALGVDDTYDATMITITDSNPPTLRTFYKFVAEQL